MGDREGIGDIQYQKIKQKGPVTYSCSFSDGRRGAEWNVTKPGLV